MGIPTIQTTLFFAAEILTASPTEVGLSTPSIRFPMLTDLIKRQLVDRVMAGATEAAGRGKTILKVAPFILTLVANPPY